LNIQEDGSETSISAGSAQFNNNDSDQTNIDPVGVTVTDGTDTTEMLADGFYINGQKIGVLNGYSGQIDVITDVDVDFDNEDYTADVVTLTFVDGVLTSVD
jgi:hypothetical protein